jgi:hypothetical protein
MWHGVDDFASQAPVIFSGEGFSEQSNSRQLWFPTFHPLITAMSTRAEGYFDPLPFLEPLVVWAVAIVYRV